MATTTHVPLEVYLRTDYEPDAEYVDGEILERPRGEFSHADWQEAICAFFRKQAAACYRDEMLTPASRFEQGRIQFELAQISNLLQA